MRSFIIATMLTFALVACEDTTETATETTESEKGTTFIGVDDNSGTTTNTNTQPLRTRLQLLQKTLEQLSLLR
jgi:hypothetical protein